MQFTMNSRGNWSAPRADGSVVVMVGFAPAGKEGLKSSRSVFNDRTYHIVRKTMNTDESVDRQLDQIINNEGA